MTNGAYNQFTVSVIDGQTEDTVKTISLPAGDGGNMVVDPVTGKVYIRTNNGLDVIESEATGVIDVAGAAPSLQSGEPSFRTCLPIAPTAVLQAEWMQQSLLSDIEIH